MSATPAVTVLMAVRDGAAHLTQTLASLDALVAPEGDFEIVAVDDASSDATPALLAAWARRNSRVRLRLSRSPLGLAGALNLGLGDVRAPLVARADGDDLYHPERLVRQAAAMRADPGLAALSCGYVRMNGDGSEIGRVVPVTGPERIRFRMLYTNSLLHPGAMIRTEALRAVSGYDTAFWTAQDSDLWARLIQSGARLDNLSEPLVHYRVHQGSVMGRRGATGRALSLTVPERMQRAYLGGLPKDHDVAATVDLWQGYHPLSESEIRAGLAGLARIAGAARRREGAEVLADLRATIARALWRQARWTGRRNAPLVAGLLIRAAGWKARP